MTLSPSLIDEIEDALASQAVEKRDAALWHITDLFIAGSDTYTEDHVTLFDDVIGRLAATIEANARARLSSRLARVPNAPLGVIRALAADHEIAVAEPVLRHSPRLDDEYLKTTAATHSQQHLLAIAQRAALSEQVTDVLVQRGDRDVVRSVAQNNGARFSSAAFKTLVERSVADDVLAVHVGTRHDLPRQHLLRLVEVASSAVRQKLAAADPAAAAAIREVVAEIGGNIRAASRRASSDYASARAEVEALHRTGQLSEQEVYGFADARKFEETAVALSLITGAPIDLVERAMLDDNPDMAVILAKVAGFSWSTAQCILLRAANRSLSVQDLDRALSGFSRLKPATARSIIAFYDARRQGGAPARAAG
ncbi:MAG: DUF2336 domain-containing protein [Alphaproteobacteria bacterium]|nr:MAG: DUF2336 domain-containing protein [Alphaproteobacteria bacterium]